MSNEIKTTNVTADANNNQAAAKSKKEPLFTVRGNLGADPEIITTKRNQPMARFNLGVGRKDEETRWYGVTCFDPLLAEAIGQHVTKGQYITVTGRKETRFVVVEGELRKYQDIILGADSSMIL